MGVYIRGMNMPKDREQYHRVTIYGNGQVIIDHGTYYEEAEAIPAADVWPVKEGRWIELENPDYSPFDPTSQEYDLLCSRCGATHYGKNKNFCPNCGAKMGGQP